MIQNPQQWLSSSSFSSVAVFFHGHSYKSRYSHFDDILGKIIYPLPGGPDNRVKGLICFQPSVNIILFSGKQRWHLTNISSKITDKTLGKCLPSRNLDVRH